MKYKFEIGVVCVIATIMIIPAIFFPHVYGKDITREGKVTVQEQWMGAATSDWKTPSIFQRLLIDFTDGGQGHLTLNCNAYHTGDTIKLRHFTSWIVESVTIVDGKVGCYVSDRDGI